MTQKIKVDKIDTDNDFLTEGRQQIYENFGYIKPLYVDTDNELYLEGLVDTTKYRIAKEYMTNKNETGVYFNGTNAVGTVADNDNLSFTDGTKDRPFAFQINLEDLLLNRNNGLLSKGQASGGYEYGILISSDKLLQISLRNADSTKYLTWTSSSRITQTSGAIFITYDALSVASGTTSIKVYLNGIEIAGSSVNVNDYTNMQNLAGNFKLANYGDAYYGKFTVSKFRAFNYVPSLATIQKYSYGSVDYADIGASNADLTSGNGSFATDTTSWWVAEQGTFVWNSSTQDATYTATTANPVQGIYYPGFISGKKYRVSFKAKANGYTGKPSIWFGGNVDYVGILNPNLTTSFQDYVFECVLGNLNSAISLRILSNAMVGTTFTIDNIIIQQIGCVFSTDSDTITDAVWYDNSGNGNNITLTNTTVINKKDYKPYINNYAFDSRGSNVASATTITPTGEIFHVTGTTAIATINIPYIGFNGSIKIIPDGIFTTTTAGNIALASTAVVSKALIMVYDSTTSKWYPSY